MRRVMMLCGIATLFSACAATQSAGPSPDVPAWTKEQCVVRDNTMHAVGLSNFRDLIVRREDAELQARAALADCVAARVAREHGQGETTTRSFADTELAGSQIATRWVDPSTGVEYALAVVAVQ